jgi:hypothetical protein
MHQQVNIKNTSAAEKTIWNRDAPPTARVAAVTMRSLIIHNTALPIPLKTVH